MMTEKKFCRFIELKKIFRFHSLDFKNAFDVIKVQCLSFANIVQTFYFFFASTFQAPLYPPPLLLGVEDNYWSYPCTCLGYLEVEISWSHRLQLSSQDPKK